MENLVFESIKEAHLPQLQNIYNYYVLNTTVTFHTEILTVEEMKKLVMFPDGRFQAYGIWDRGACVGYTVLQPYKTRQAYCFTAEVAIYLGHEFIGLGIGQKALDFIEAVAKNNGFHTIVASICSENSRSKQLFLNKGYNPCAQFQEVGYKFGRFLSVEYFQKIIRDVIL